MDALHRAGRLTATAVVALLLLATVGVAPATADVTRELASGETYCVGQTLTFAGESDYELYRVTEPEGDQPVEPEYVMEVDVDDGQLSVDTEGLAADRYMVVEASRADDGNVTNDGAVVREGEVRGSGSALMAGWSLDTCPSTARLAGGSQTVRFDETARFTLETDFPADDTLYLHSPGLDNDMLASFVDGADLHSKPNTDIDDWVRVDAPADGELPVAIPFDAACGPAGGSFELRVAGAKMGASATARSFVRVDEDDAYRFEQRSFYGRQGDTVEIGVGVRGCSDDVTVRIADQDPAFSLHVEVEDASDDGVVTLQVDTASLLSDPDDAVSAGTDEVTSVTLNTDVDGATLPYGNYVARLDAGTRDVDAVPLILDRGETTTTTATAPATTTATTTTTPPPSTTSAATTSPAEAPPTTTSSTTGPGFGPLGALGALAATAMVALRRSYHGR